MINDLELQTVHPIAELSNFVESFWLVNNSSAVDREIVVLPDGRFDIIFSYSINKPFSASLRGLDTVPEQAVIPANMRMFAISFKLLAIEYLLDIKMASILNGGQSLTTGFWNVTSDDLNDFGTFCNKVTITMLNLIKPKIDSRKQKLFDLVYITDGSRSVHELATNVGWSSRQINRYFNEQFGISLKAYCNILRFKASLPQIKDGRLFPEQNFTDQTHFIKEIKKFSGVSPKELSKNQNDRFILLSGLPKK